MTAELYTPKQVADMWGVNIRTVQTWVRKGVLPARRLGGRWLIDPDDARKLLKPIIPAQTSFDDGVLAKTSHLTVEWCGRQNPLLPPEEQAWLVQYHDKSGVTRRKSIALDNDLTFFFGFQLRLYGRLYATRDNRVELLELLDEILTHRPSGGGEELRFFLIRETDSDGENREEISREEITLLLFGWCQLLRDAIASGTGDVDVDLFPLRKQLDAPTAAVVSKARRKRSADVTNVTVNT